LRHEENQIEVHSDHSRLDARSLAMHVIIAKKLLVDPSLLDQARNTRARWKAQAAGEPVAIFFLSGSAFSREVMRQSPSF